MAATEGVGDAASTLVNFAQTDDTGRYRLEKVAPGQYYIIAGRIDSPIYYPGVKAKSGATVVTIRRVDPKGPASGQSHVLRGGSWAVPPALLRASDRVGSTNARPDTSPDANVGSRLARDRIVL